MDNEEKSDKGANGSGGRVDTQDGRAVRREAIRENMGWYPIQTLVGSKYGI